MNNKIEIPNGAKIVIDELQHAGYEAYVVGGCVRDSLLNKTPNDWDITSSALANDTINIFKNKGYRVIETGLKHGTVTILIESIPYEVTTFRIEGEYSDNRHPDKVDFTPFLEEDLKRRDFTINAMAYNDKVGLMDFFGGIKDLGNGVIKCVGNPCERFKEDALRMLRALRFQGQLGFEIENKTMEALKELNENIENISMERIRVELCKMIVGDYFCLGMNNLYLCGLMDLILPELSRCWGFDQRTKYHCFNIFDHTIETMKNTESKLDLRLSALFHDISKPECFTIDEEGHGHFYKHDILGADRTREIMKRLKFDNKTIDKISKLVYDHMNREPHIKNKAIKNLINRVGRENLEDLFALQIADLKASAPKYRDFDCVIRLREKCKKILNEKQPLNVKDLAVNGKDLINIGYIQGAEIGTVLNKLMEMVMDNPQLNSKDKLLEIVRREIL